jgi:hypothetical protein
MLAMARSIALPYSFPILKHLVTALLKKSIDKIKNIIIMVLKQISGLLV